MTKWKRFTGPNEDLIDDRTYLVNWIQPGDYCYSNPILAYWNAGHKRFFPLYSHGAFPVHVDLYLEIPDINVQEKNKEIQLSGSKELVYPSHITRETPRS